MFDRAQDSLCTAQIQQDLDQREKFERPVSVGYGDDQPPARPDKTAQAGDKGRGVLDMFQDLRGDHQIELSFGNGLFDQET